MIRCKNSWFISGPTVAILEDILEEGEGTAINWEGVGRSGNVSLPCFLRAPACQVLGDGAGDSCAGRGGGWRWVGGGLWCW